MAGRGRKSADRLQRQVSEMHDLQLYDDGAFPVQSLADFLQEGVQKGEGIFAGLTAEHMRGVVRALRKRGVRFDMLVRTGRALFLDAEALLPDLLVKGHPDRRQFSRLVCSRIDGVIPTGGSGRGVAELAPLLMVRESAQAAIQLERIWESCISRRPVTTRCIYSLSLFTNPKFANAFYLIVDAHRHVVYPLEGKGEPTQERTLAASFEQMRLLSRYFMRVREDERTRMSRRVHDELGQQLVSLRFDLARLSQKLRQDTSSLAPLSQQALSTVDELLRRVRGVASELRPPTLDLGLLAAIEWQAQDFQARTGISVKLLLPRRIEESDLERATEVFRIFEAALSNVARHSQAKTVAVRVANTRTGLDVSIRDDGIGMADKDAVSSESLGLVGMRERADAIGARIRIAGT
ncbi:MAG TPA: MEDS domain-containing protein, partial [Spirochaetia bacterium]|nr:MEDS domain-containing protein [Spirochaetia bacterium]